MINSRRFLFAGLLSLALSAPTSWAQNANSGDLNTLPVVADEYDIVFAAREPLTRNPCAMAFDFKGRLFVGMGPQYRSPTPDTPGDSVFILQDPDGDGVFDQKHEFASGFNNIQALCWHGSDLWIANAPDLTIVSDTDGDNLADKYIRLYTDLGNLEHGLHGLTWGPDGRMYMSKGNSKGHNGPELFAPEPFHDLSGVAAPPGTSVFPEPLVTNAADYIKTYHDPADDWGREGGVLSCLDLGHDLRIESRGYRNPWDIAYDHEFNFIGTDNDQDQGDRVFHSFLGAHYGWGHPWSAHWRCNNHLPTPELVGPMFGGSGTGITYFNSPAFPPQLQGVWMFNDWLQRRTHFFQTRWKGAQLTLAGEQYSTLVSGGNALFKPTDLEVGPDGALYILGWGREYGVQWDNHQKQINEGRIFRVSWKGNQAQTQLKQQHERWKTPLKQWQTSELIDGLDDVLPVRRIAAQEELLQRKDGPNQIFEALDHGALSVQQTSWALWAFIRSPYRQNIPDDFFYRTLTTGPVHQRIQALRCLRHLTNRSNSASHVKTSLDTKTVNILKASLVDTEARIRFEAHQFLADIEHLPPEVRAAVVLAINNEQDSNCFYASWHVLKRHFSPKQLQGLLQSNRPRLQLAALLAAAEIGEIKDEVITNLLKSDSADLRATAALWSTRKSGNSMFYINHPGGEFTESISVTLLSYLKPSQIYYSLDGSTPDRSSLRWPGRLTITKSCLLKAAVYSGDQQIGRVAEFRYQRIGVQAAAEKQGVLSILSETNRPYLISGKPPAKGVKAYSDRAYEITEISEGLRNTVLLRTPNNDSEEIRAKLVTIEFAIPTTVFIAHDQRIDKPNWLTSWEKITETLVTNDASYQVFRKTVPAGKLVLGANRDSVAGGASQYIVLFKPGNLTRLSKVTTIEASKAKLRTADSDRGRALFFATGGAGCHKCHLANDSASNSGFGPNLEFLKRQKDPEHILESLLKPSAKIKEGFATQIVIKTDGTMLTGILKNETGEAVLLNQTNGEIAIVPRDQIDERFTQEVSAMPAFDRMLNPQQAADLTKFLLGN